MERGERGSVLPLLVLAVILAGAMAMALGRLGAAAAARARARTAADAAALAGAAEGRPAAEAVAAANGARVLSYEQLGLDARVRVAVGPAEAVARARREGAVPPAPGGDPAPG